MGDEAKKVKPIESGYNKYYCLVVHVVQHEQTMPKKLKQLKQQKQKQLKNQRSLHSLLTQT